MTVPGPVAASMAVTEQVGTPPPPPRTRYTSTINEEAVRGKMLTLPGYPFLLLRVIRSWTSVRKIMWQVSTTGCCLRPKSE